MGGVGRARVRWFGSDVGQMASWQWRESKRGGKTSRNKNTQLALLLLYSARHIHVLMFKFRNIKYYTLKWNSRTSFLFSGFVQGLKKS